MLTRLAWCSRHSSVSITGCTTVSWFESRLGQRHFSSTQRPHKLWGPLSVLCNGYGRGGGVGGRVLLRRHFGYVKTLYHSPLSSADVTKEWAYAIAVWTGTSPVSDSNMANSFASLHFNLFSTCEIIWLTGNTPTTSKQHSNQTWTTLERWMIHLRSYYNGVTWSKVWRQLW